MRIDMLAIWVVVSSLAGTAIPAAMPPELQPFAFLVGEWAASGSGQPGAGVGTAKFSLSLQDRVILRTNYAEYPAAGGKPESRHDDLMVIYMTAAGVRADYYDSEGHVIRYRVDSPAPDKAVFLSEPADGEPTFRLTYRSTSKDALDGEFEILPQGADTFVSYLSWHSRRVAEAVR